MTDLTTMPIGSGFWVSWLPFSLPQCWPFCWWIGVVIDHYSRRIMGVTLFWKEPTSQAVRAFLGRVMHAAKAKPRHLVTDKGPQFCNKDFKPWCRGKHIKPRFGAIGQHGSIAVVERLILTLKQYIARLLLVPLRRGRADRDRSITRRRERLSFPWESRVWSSANREILRTTSKTRSKAISF